MVNLEKIVKGGWNRIKKRLLSVAITIPLVFCGISSKVYGNDEYKPTYAQTKRNLTNSLNDSKPYDIGTVLVMGVDRVDPPVKYKDYFDKIIHLSEGNRLVDYPKATAEHLGIPTGSLSELYGKKANIIYAHSWGADSVINEIKIGTIEPPNKLILIDPPGAYRNWKEILPKVNVEVYPADKSGFRFIPEISIKDTRIKPTDNKPTIVASWTIQFGAGKSNIHPIDATHYLDNCLDVIFKEKGIEPLQFQSVGKVDFGKSLESSSHQSPNTKLLPGSYPHLNIPKIYLERQKPPQKLVDNFQNLFDSKSSIPSGNFNLELPDTKIPTLGRSFPSKSDYHFKTDIYQPTKNFQRDIHKIPEMPKMEKQNIRIPENKTRNYDHKYR